MYVRLYAPREREPIGALGVVVSLATGTAARACSWSVGPSRLLGADRRSVLGHHHVRVVALEGECASNKILRFVLRFRAGGRDGRGSRAWTLALPGSLIGVDSVSAETLGNAARRDAPISLSEGLGALGPRGRRSRGDGAPRRVAAGRLTINAEFSLFSRQ